MDSPADGLQRSRVISVIDGSNLHVRLKAHAQPTRLHYTNLSIEAAKRLPANLRPWVFVRTFSVAHLVGWGFRGGR